MAPTGSWSTRATHSYGMYYGGGCSDGARYLWYHGGGYDVYATQRYDSTTNTWSRVNTSAPTYLY